MDGLQLHYLERSEGVPDYWEPRQQWRRLQRPPRGCWQLEAGWYLQEVEEEEAAGAADHQNLAAVEVGHYCCGRMRSRP